MPVSARKGATVRAVARALRDGHDALLAALGRCELPVDPAKTAIAASSPEMMRMAALAARAPALASGSSWPRKLGVAYGLGRKRGSRASALQTSRLSRAAVRLQRARRLRTPAGGQAKVVFAGAVPAAVFGAEECGVSLSAARALERRCAAAAAFGGPGADPALVWAAHGARHHSLADLATASPLLRYAREWWEALHPQAMVRRRALSVTEF